MTSADTPSRPPLPVILHPYRSDPDTPRRRRARRWAVTLLGLFSLFWGLVFAFFAPALILILLAPVLILALLSIWALPDLRTAPTRALERFFFAYLVTAILWPSYISIALPDTGLPWVSPQRLIYTPMAVIFLICVAVSRDLRARIGALFRAEPVIFWLMIVFMIIVTYTVAFSDRIFSTMDKWADAEVTWGCMFFIASYLFTQPGRVTRWVRTLWVCAVISGLIGVWEWRLQHVPWYGVLPGFLQMDPQMAATIAPNVRSLGSAVYRVRSTFQDPLGLGEFMSLIIPFLLIFAMGRFKWPTRVGAMLTVFFLSCIVVLSDARSGMVGVLVDFTLFGLYWGLVQWRDRKESLIGPALVLSYPILAAVGLASTFLVDRIRLTVWGGGAGQYSNLARKEQFGMAGPKILSHPLGYGIGRGAHALGFYTPSGHLTLDTYYLTVVLDYGVIGFMVFYSLILYSSFTAIRYGLKSDGHDKETVFLPAAAIALISFFVIKSVYSEPNNHPFYFMLMGMIPALVYRLKLSRRSAAAEAPREAVPTRALAPRPSAAPAR